MTLGSTLQVQYNMNKVVHGVGGLTHSQWRAFKSERRPLTKSSESRGFIDGDLVEMFLNLSREDMEQV
jgi:DNA damage-binding protein 1